MNSLDKACSLFKLDYGDWFDIIASVINYIAVQLRK